MKHTTYIFLGSLTMVLMHFGWPGDNLMRSRPFYFKRLTGVHAQLLLHCLPSRLTKTRSYTPIMSIFMSHQTVQTQSMRHIKLSTALMTCRIICAFSCCCFTPLSSLVSSSLLTTRNMLLVLPLILTHASLPLFKTKVSLFITTAKCPRNTFKMLMTLSLGRMVYAG